MKSKVLVKIWAGDSDNIPDEFESTGEKFWCGCGWGWEYQGYVSEADIKKVAYGEAIYFGEADFPIERASP